MSFVNNAYSPAEVLQLHAVWNNDLEGGNKDVKFIDFFNYAFSTFVV